MNDPTGPETPEPEAAKDAAKDSSKDAKTPKGAEAGANARKGAAKPEKEAEKPADPPKKEAEAAPPAARPEIRLRLFGRTDVGQVREHNEDNFIVADLTKGSRGLMESDRTQLVGERGTLLGVCDGM